LAVISNGFNNLVRLQFVPVVGDNILVYIKVGVQSYEEHYQYLWKHRDITPFIAANLTQQVVEHSLSDPCQKLFIIYRKNTAVGILALTLDALLDMPDSRNNILLNKLYLLRAATGSGIGTAALSFLEKFARAYHKQLLWLFTMQKGKPKYFYWRNGYKIVKPAEITLPNVLDEEKPMWLMVKRLNMK